MTTGDGVRESGTRLLHVTTVPMSLTFLRGQVGFMKERGLEVHALSSPGDGLWEFGAREGVPVYAVEMPRRITPLGDLAALWKIYRRVRRVRPAIVHSHTAKGGLLGTLGAWLARVPVRVYHMRGLPLETASGPKRTLLWWTDRIACALAHRVICVSHSLRAIVVEEGLCPPHKIDVLLGGSGNGVDAARRFDPRLAPEGARHDTRARFAIPADALVIGFVGRIVRDKGVSELVEAWRALRDEFPGAHLLVVGPYEPQDPIAEHERDLLEKDPRVHLAGMDWNTVPLFSSMDLLVLPTYREGFPNVLLEAAAMELPVVATRVAGCVDAVEEGRTGMLVPPRDGVALAAAIREYLSSAALRRDHGTAGRERVLRLFSPEGIWRELHAEYVRLLRERGLNGSAPPTAASPRGSQ